MYKWEVRFVVKKNKNRKKMPYPVDMHWFLHVVVREELASAHRLEHVSHDAGVVNDCEQKKKKEGGKKKKKRSWEMRGVRGSQQMIFIVGWVQMMTATDCLDVDGND